MDNYIDAFVLPIPSIYLEEYKQVVGNVSKIWKEHGALAYCEFVGDDLYLDGTRSFIDLVDVKEDEVIIFGWVVFDSKETRDLANKLVISDPRMTDLITPLIDPARIVFNAQRMAFGGFRKLV